jgi:MFS family permease
VPRSPRREGLLIERDTDKAIPTAVGDRLYSTRFFQTFAAVALFMTGNSLQYHFGEYVAGLGHGVDTLGLVLSVSMAGSLLLRLRIGEWIDRLGCKPTWIAGGLVMAGAVGAVQWAESVWLLIVLRTVVAMATAMVMTTVAVFAAQIAPPPRRAESIGILGLAGMVGMTLGPALGDWIFSGPAPSAGAFRTFFTASAVFSLASCAVIAPLKVPGQRRGSQLDDAGRPGVRPIPEVNASQLRVVLRHWPGAVLLVGVAFAMVLCLQMLFLERLADLRGFHDIKAFFLVYCPTAIALRLLLRRMPERVGRGRTLLIGLALEAAGLVFMIGIRGQTQLLLPGLLMGAGHSLIFPSMVDIAAERLPPSYRGTGTALILGAGDLGMLIGYATLGAVIDRWGFDAAIMVLVISVVSAGAIFGYLRRGQVFYGVDIPVAHQEGT